MTILIVTLAGVAYTIWRIQAHSNRPALVPTPTRGAVTTNTTPCVACGKPAARPIRAGYDTWDLCPRCREAVNALTGVES